MGFFLFLAVAMRGIAVGSRRGGAFNASMMDENLDIFPSTTFATVRKISKFSDRAPFIVEQGVDAIFEQSTRRPFSRLDVWAQPRTDSS